MHPFYPYIGMSVNHTTFGVHSVRWKHYSSTNRTYLATVRSAAGNTFLTFSGGVNKLASLGDPPATPLALPGEPLPEKGSGVPWRDLFEPCWENGSGVPWRDLGAPPEQISGDPAPSRLQPLIEAEAANSTSGDLGREMDIWPYNCSRRSPAEHRRRRQKQRPSR